MSAYSRADLSEYQRIEIRRLEHDGWTVGRITRIGEEWATIEIGKGEFRTKAGLAASKAVERAALEGVSSPVDWNAEREAAG